MIKKKIITKTAIFIVLMIAVFLLGMNIKNTKAGNKVIAIDVGHGGNDPGKVSANSTMEKDINLAIGLELERELLARGYTVILTRRIDTNLASDSASNKKSSDMRNRVQLVNETNADIMISIHQNSFPDTSVKGAQCFYQQGSEKGKVLAELIQEYIIKKVDITNKRKAKTSASYYILKNTSCPGVIVECGFLSNSAEEANLKDKQYQHKLAVAIGDALDEFF